MGSADDEARRARLRELQRRLYRPGATAADLQRYEALRDELTAPPPPPVPEDTPPAARMARRRPLLLAGAVLGAAAICGAVVLLQVPADVSAPLARGSAASTPRSAVQVPSRSPQLSERFNGDAATPVGTTVEVAVDGTRVLAQRFSGSGTALVTLITGGAPLDGGLLTVTLRTARRVPASWQAEAGDRSASTGGRIPDPPRSGTASPRPTSVEYTGAPPAAIRVQAPADTAWTLVVAFSR